jgi:hypothetical protein
MCTIKWIRLKPNCEKKKKKNCVKWWATRYKFWKWRMNSTVNTVMNPLANNTLTIVKNHDYFQTIRGIDYENDKEIINPTHKSSTKLHTLKITHNLLVITINFIPPPNFKRQGRLEHMCWMCDGTGPPNFRKILGPLNFEVLLFFLFFSPWV